MSRFRSPAFAFALLSLFGSSGCVALNLPSHRYHDPSDQGGLLGNWESGVLDPASLAGAGSFSHSSSSTSLDSCRSAGCLDGGPLDVDPMDASAGEHAIAEEPKVPWPRFHPVPTRPLLSAGQ